MTKVVISLGTNIGKRELNLQDAIKRMAKVGKIIRMSHVYISEPWGFMANNDFYNQVVEIETHLGPYELLQSLLIIETEMGRTRNEIGYESRIIDLDVLFYSNDVIETDELGVPHKHIQDRRFILEPLNEIMQEHRHPVLGKTIKQLLEECKDNLRVVKLMP